MLEEERAQDGRAYYQEDTRADPACGGLRGVGVAGAEFAVHLAASDTPDARADGVDEYRRRVKVGSDHAGGFGDARHAVALRENLDVGSQQEGREDDLLFLQCLCHNLFCFVPPGWMFPLAVDTCFNSCGFG